MEPIVPAYLLAIAQEIENHLNRIPTEEYFASAHNVSVSKLQKDFTFYFGYSFQEYHSQIKMQAAAKLLKETRQPVKSIARNLGYHSGEAFARAFRKFSGLSPSTYRKNH